MGSSLSAFVSGGILVAESGRRKDRPRRLPLAFGKPRVSRSVSVMSDQDVLAARGPKVPVDPWQPVAAFVEPERQVDGRVLDVATLFLANRECPFRCVFCDLWRQTLDDPTPSGAIPQQIDVALARLPEASVLKLYNSGNFFDAAAVPPSDWPEIAARARRFELVVVENHPRLTDERCLRFRDLLGTQLEIALGLETVHPDVLPRLNKRMTVDDFADAARFLVEHGIAVRAFVLLRPPFMSESEGIEWALRSIEFAFDCGANCVSVIPTRVGNGAMDRLQRDGNFSPPRLSSLEAVLSAGIEMRRGRVFADTWDIARFADCQSCADARVERLRQMNLSQSLLPDVTCCKCSR